MEKGAEAVNEVKEVTQGVQQKEVGTQVPVQADPVQKIKDLEDQLKKRDSEVSDLRTTVATIESRFSQTAKEKEETQNKNVQDQDAQSRIKRILENSAYDPDGASRELQGLFGEVESKASERAVQRAMQTINQKNALDAIRNGVKSSNPDFDDDIVDTIIDRAEVLAGSGKYKSADEAVKVATEFVKSKFENYANKKNSIQPLPSGANAETGSNPAPQAPIREKVQEPNEFIEQRQDLKSKKIL